MIGGTVTHLLPSVPPVAVGAEQSQVASIGLPIAQPIVPGSRTPLFQAPVDVVDVENAVVGFSAINARSTKLRNERQLPSPIARMLVSLVRVGRPVSVAAGDIAKAMLAGFPALLARLGALPSSGKIASLSAVFPAAVSQSVKVRLARLGAVRAGDFNGALFHARNIARTAATPKYFDIAVRRIREANGDDAGPLFGEAA